MLLPFSPAYATREDIKEPDQLNVNNNLQDAEGPANDKD